MVTTKTLVAVFSGLIGLILYFLLPNAYKVFSFILPALGLSYIFAEDGISFTILLVLSLVFVLFPSSLITLDVGYSDKILTISNYVDSFSNILGGIFLLGIPIFVVIGAVYAFYVGNITEAVQNIIKVIAAIAISIFAIVMGDVVGYDIFGFKDGLISLWNTVYGIYEAVVNGAATLLNGIDVLNIIPDIPKVSTEVDTAEKLIALSFGSNRAFALTMSSSYPLILDGVALILGLLSFAFQGRFPVIKGVDTANPLTRPRQTNYSFLVFMVILLFIYFAVYLWLGEKGFLQYRELGFFTIYLSTILFSTLVMAFGFGSTTTNNQNTLLGIIYGVSMLHFVFTFFTQVEVQTLSVVKLEYETKTIETWYQILVQFIAVAPTESLLFHVVLPAMVLYVIFSRKKSINATEIEQQIDILQTKIQNENMALTFYQTQLLKPKLTAEQQVLIKKDLGDNYDFSIALNNITSLNKQIKELEAIRNTPITPNSSMLTTSEWVIFILANIAFNFLFSSLHWFNSGLDFRVFWASGLGLVYLLSGLVIFYVGYRYGWLAAILVHAINNSFGLIMVLIGAI